ncbi:hypothetical protein HKT18_07975 [Flavobacterium sp. IMCC34852]|uniref:Uncharacterized protein n=1 Tax=Flavobacterium rivulicola TaxID=2732161 RepID=A0A7Y3R940_9FLAO|nr:hypothetical protein [Flavobacterium sp. IMCC34852]NNT72147.1 hypothetical protein [Flavobacterium sp. IMCC34852]
MTTNFKIIDNYALKFNDRLIDVHNNFDFVGFDYRVAENQLKLFCRKSFGVWVNKEEPEQIILVHNNVNNLVVENQSGNREDSLTEITFYQNDEPRKPEELTLREKPNENDDIFYIFESGKVIRIGCGEIFLEVY